MTEHEEATYDIEMYQVTWAKFGNLHLHWASHLQHVCDVITRETVDTVYVC